MKTVYLFTDDDLDQIEEARVAVETSIRQQVGSSDKRLADSDPVAHAAAEYDRVKAEALERATKVELAKVPRLAWREMVLKHTPREDNEGDQAWGFNQLTLGDDLVPGCVTSTHPVGFLDSLSDGEFSQLFQAALDVNQRRHPDPKASMSSQLALTSGETSKPQGRLA